MSELALKLIEENKKTKNPFLDLGNCGLTELPEILFGCTWLTRINFSRYYYDDKSKIYFESKNNGQNNSLQKSNLSLLEKISELNALDLIDTQITDISNLEKLTGLQTLDLSGNKITDISILEKLTGLQTLDLRNNHITDISNLEKLTGLQKLYLSNNKITDISNLEKLTGLQTLDLRNNQITDISNLEKLTGLQTLYLSNNQITDISNLEKLTGLQTLYLSVNQITDISNLEKLTGLQTLYLSANKITDISILEKLTGLQTLDLRKNHITDISNLEKLTGLQTLYLSGNKITDISNLEKLTGLQTLNLGGNKITDISILEKLTGLQTLYLGGNKITDISNLEKLTGLQKLGLNYNKITDISNLEKLTGLQTLDLSKNRIADISPILSLIKNRVRVTFKQYDYAYSINLFDNPLTTPPLHIVEQGNEAIISWFENIKVSELKPFREGKIILLGEPDAGKTNLLNYFLGKEFVEKKEVTKGVNIAKYIFNENGHEYQINFWDFGGQEIQQSMHQYFLTDKTLYIILLNAVTDEQPDKYIQFLDNNAPNSPFIIVTNKDDLNSVSKLRNNKLASDYEGRLISSDRRISLYQASGIKRCSNNQVKYRSRKNEMKELLDIIKSNFVKMPHLEEGFLENYKEVKKHIERLYKKDKKPYLTNSEFIKLCNEKGIVTGTENGLLSHLDFIGTVRFIDETNLRGLHVLNPEWLSDGIYRIITDNDVKNKHHGRIPKNIVAGILKPGVNTKYVYQDDEIDFIITMMRQFKVAYYNENEEIIYLPCCFPDDIPQEFNKKELKENAKHYYFSYDTEIPSYIISRFIVKNFQFVRGNIYWNKGIVLENMEQITNPCEALIEQNDRIIDIWVKGKDIQAFFAVIRTTLRDSHEKVYKKYKELIDLEEESVLYDEIVNLKYDGDITFKGKIIDETTGKLKIYNINEVLGIFETQKEINQMDKHSDNININFNIENKPNFQQRNENVNENKVNIKINVSEKPEFENIKNILLDLQEEAADNKEWQDTLIKCLDAFNRMEIAEDLAAQKTSKSIIERCFNKLKVLKDAVAISFLAVDINDKWPKLLELWDKLKSYLK